MIEYLMPTLRDITQEEWDRYDWVPVNIITGEECIYLRGIEKTPKPDDGFVYEDVTKFGDKKQVWKRVKTVSPD